MSTWHYGLVARWWAEFNREGPEVEYFRPFVAAGQPALDAGCGTGRLLLPWLRDGLDVDGCDVSPDMLAECRRLAAAEGLEPTLYAQALHELALPRRYRSIVCCGTFGLGSTRAQDEEALRRLYDHLEPGGLLVLDIDANGDVLAAEPHPGQLEPPAERLRAADGSEYSLRGRVIAVDRAERRVTRAIQAWQWRDGELVAEEEHLLTEAVYAPDELARMLERAGFGGVEARSGDSAWGYEMVAFLARRPVR
ncbi:MAG TPA: methyltransferase domain-containing protein [Gaiellaceae bacterium]|nr:methyltransferase domain-containing protein [Gaiellaceae bacterium]